MNEKHFECDACKHQWSVPFGAGRIRECPQCKSTLVHKAMQNRGKGRQRGYGSCKKQERRAAL